MDIFNQIKQDHEKTRQLATQIEALSDEQSEERERLFSKFREELLLHAHSEEKAFYKPLEKFDETSEEIEHAYEEHEEAENLLEQIAATDAGSPEWITLFRKLRQSLEHHMQEEENEMFRRAQKVVDDNDAEAMSEKMEEFKEEERETVAA
jgi:hemerythrin superfamily protein